MLVAVEDEKSHRSHFLMRAHESRNRPSEQKYLKSMALQHGVPLVPSYNLDATLSQVIDLVVGRAIRFS